MWFHLEGVLGTGLEEAEEIFNNRGSRVVSFEIYKPFSVDWWGIDKGWLLGVVDKITRVDT